MREIKHAAIYIRKSQKKKGKVDSRLLAQREDLPAYASEQGWTHEIYDDGYASASKNNLDNLTQRKRMEQDIRDRKIDVILVIEVSRLSRDESMGDLVAWFELCAKYNVGIATETQMLNPSEISDWTLLVVTGGLSSAEMKMLKLRMEQGRRKAYLEGKWKGGPLPQPYKYEKTYDETYHKIAYKVVVDKSALLTIQNVWLLAESHSAKAIAKKTGMSYSSVRLAISEARLDFCQAQRLDSKTGQMIKCQWEAVMTADQAARIRSSRRTRSTNGQSTTPSSLLSGLGILKCGYCGRTVKTWSNGKSRKNGTKLKYYGCNTMNSACECVKSRTISQLILDERVLTNTFNTIGCLNDLMSHWVASQSDQDFTGKVKELEVEEKDLQKKIDRLVIAVAEGTLTGDLVLRTRTGFENRRALIQAEMVKLESRKMSPPDWDSLMLTSEEFDHLDFVDQRRFLALIFDEIRVYDRYAILVYRFPRTSTGDRTARIHLPPPQRGPTKGRKPRIVGTPRNRTKS